MPEGRVRRNLTAELLQGGTDGALKKPRPDWSNPDLYDTTEDGRRELSVGAGPGGGFDWSPREPANSDYLRGIVRGA